MENTDKKELKERIIALLEKEARAFNHEELKSMLELDSFDLLSAALIELEKEHAVKFTKTKRYELNDEAKNYKVGYLSVKGDYGFVDVGDNKDDNIFVSSSNFNEAINGDKVIAEITRKTKRGLEGRIVEVLERKNQLVGEVFIKDGSVYVDIDDAKLAFHALIDPKYAMHAVTGEKVVIELGKRISSELYEAKITKVIGHKDDPGSDILSEAYEAGIDPEFSKETLEQLKTIPDHVLENEYIGRVDLRNEEIFTIDGDDTKDIDDAISIKKLDNGNYLLGVHIADVSHYVKRGTPLFNDAYKRGTSHYLANTVIPMLPHQLSNGICSLNPNVDRLTLSIDMEIDSTGRRVDYRVYKAVIHSQIQMTYNKVNDILDKGIVAPGYEKHVETLKLMNELSLIMNKRSFERGAIMFDTTESKFKFNALGKIIAIIKRFQGTGEKLIENFMISANCAAADFADKHDKPILYRVHELPKEEKLNDVLELSSILGHPVTGKIRHVKHPKVLQALNEQFKTFKESKILQMLLLRAMAKAKYTKEKILHFALALKELYAHFTSPIRRFPDLLLHHAIHDILDNLRMDPQSLREDEKFMAIAGPHLSERERVSDECERSVEAMKKAEFMMDQVGEEFDAQITDVKSFGFFVTLDNTVEGLVRLEDLNNGKTRFFYDEATYSIRAENSPIIYPIGDSIRVKCTGASKTDKKVDFFPAKQLELAKTK